MTTMLEEPEVTAAVSQRSGRLPCIAARSKNIVASGHGPRQETSGDPRRPILVSGPRRIAYLLAAGLFLLLGLLGVALPGLPTTPFLLLTNYFLIRSWPRLNAALLRSRFFGSLLTDWQVHGAVRPGVKVKAIAVTIAAVATTILITDISPLPVAMISALAMVGVTVIARLPELESAPQSKATRQVAAS